MKNQNQRSISARIMNLLSADSVPLSDAWKRLIDDADASDESIFPGVMRCPVCDFSRTHVLVTPSGLFAGEIVPEQCPNGHGPLWRDTYKRQYNDLYDYAEELKSELQERRKPQKPIVTFYSEGIAAAANWVDQQRESYDNEHGRRDNDTGSFEFGNAAQRDYSDTLAEIAEGIRALHPSTRDGEQESCKAVAWIDSAGLDLLTTGYPAEVTAKIDVDFIHPLYPDPPASVDIDRLQESAYKAGLTAGWHFGIEHNGVGFSKCLAAHEYTTPAPAPAPAPVVNDIRIKKAIAWLNRVICGNPRMKEPVTCRAALLQLSGNTEQLNQAPVKQPSSKCDVTLANEGKLPPNSFTDAELHMMAHGNNPQSNAYRELLAFRRNSPVTPDGSTCKYCGGTGYFRWQQSENMCPCPCKGCTELAAPQQEVK